VVLDQPQLLLVDQKALNVKGFDFVELFNLLSSLLPNSSIFMIMSTYEDLLVLERAIVLKEGEISEMGYIEKLIKNPNSHLSSIIQISDYKDWEDLYKKIVGETRQEHEKKKNDVKEKKRIQEVFEAIKTDLSHDEAQEYSQKHIGDKITEHLHESREPSSFFPNTLPPSFENIVVGGKIAK